MKKVKEFINYAHRGASEYAPENTFLSFYLGVSMGANGIETDVQITKDGVPVLFHDDTLIRVTGEKGSVCDYTLEELKTFWVKKGNLKDKIVTLEDFLIHFKDMDLTFAIELKSVGSAKPTADLLRKYKLKDKVILTSFNYSELTVIREYAPEFTTGYLAIKITPELLRQMKEDGIEELCPEAQAMTQDLVREWKAMGFSVRAWGVYNEELMKSAHSLGADGMTVNFPDKLTKYLLELAK
jgi:glycerophosphoryl diester phosphodiesterase